MKLKPTLGGVFAAAVLGTLVTPARADDAAPARWPRSVIARPLTLPGGVFQAGADVTANNDFSLVGARVVGGYGINDKLEVTAFYSYPIEPFEAKGDLDINVGYAAIRGAAGGKLEVVPRLQAGYSVIGEGLRPVALGAQVQYNVSAKLAVITPGQQLSIAVEEAEGGARPITLGLPLAIAYQATPELYVQLDTSLATLKIADATNAFLFADTTPVTITAVYNAMPALDVAAGAGLNLTPAEGTSAADTLAFLVGVRYYGGSL